MSAQSIAQIRNHPVGVAMIELGATVTIDGRRRGVLVGRSFSARDETMVYDVRLPADRTILNVAAQRVKTTGPARRDVIGRDLPHNPKRPHLVGETGERSAA
jgi:hypothetical protein